MHIGDRLKIRIIVETLGATHKANLYSTYLQPEVIVMKGRRRSRGGGVGRDGEAEWERRRGGEGEGEWEWELRFWDA